MLNNKIIIGTANFDQKYGVRSKKIDQNGIRKIINYAFKKKINKFDTSASYKNSEKILGNLLQKKTKVITKLPPIPKYLSDKKTELWITKQIEQSQRKLKVKSIYALLLHKPDILLTKRGKKIYQLLIDIKKKGQLKKLGISIYDFKILRKLLKFYKFDIAQVPFNVFDQRLIREKKLLNKKNKNIEIHCRSIYLQGLLHENEKKISKKFGIFKKNWKRWNSWLAEKNLSSIEGSLNFIYQKRKFFDNIVVGFDNIGQLAEISNYKFKNANFNYEKFHINNNKFYKPNFLRK